MYLDCSGTTNLVVAGFQQPNPKTLAAFIGQETITAEKVGWRARSTPTPTGFSLRRAGLGVMGAWVVRMDGTTNGGLGPQSNLRQGPFVMWEDRGVVGLEDSGSSREAEHDLPTSPVTDFTVGISGTPHIRDIFVFGRALTPGERTLLLAWYEATHGES